MFPTFPKWLIKSAFVATPAIVADAVVPVDGSLERLGTAGLLVIAAYFMLRYFMAEMAKKDVALQLMSERYLTSLQEHQKALASELRASQEFKVELNATLKELTQAVRGRHGDTGSIRTSR